MGRLKGDKIPLISSWFAQENGCGCVTFSGGWESYGGRRKRKGREERERESWEKGKPKNEMGKLGKIKENKRKRIYGLSVGELEIDFGYLWHLMIFINIRRNY